MKDPPVKTIRLLLWLGPVFVVGSYAAIFVFGALDPSFSFMSSSGQSLSMPDAAHPVLFNEVRRVLGVLLIATGCGVWLSLRLLAGRNVPFGELHPFGDLRPQLYRILPGIVGYSVAALGIGLVFPEVFSTADLFHVIEAPSVFSGWLVVWALWNVTTSSAMKMYQILTPILIIIGAIVVPGYSGLVDRAYIGLYGLLSSILYFGWLAITSYWLINAVGQSLDSARLDY